MIITFETTNTGSQYEILKPGKEDKVTPESLTRWKFDVKDEDTLTLIESGDLIIDFNLRRDAFGQVIEAAYEKAKKAAYACVHLRSFVRNDVETINPTIEQMGKVPGPVVDGFYQRVKGVDWKKVIVEEAGDKTAKKAEPGEAE